MFYHTPNIYGVTKALIGSENYNEVAFLSEMLLVNTSHIRERFVGVGYNCGEEYF